MVDQVYCSTKYLRLKVLCKKLGPKYLGPFPIMWVINPVIVELKLPPLFVKVHPVFHSSLLKPIEEGDIWALPQLQGPVGEDRYEIDRVLDS